MKISIGQLKQLIREATGGDGKRELVDMTNWQHLEVGNTYVCSVGRERVRAVFVGWVDKQGNPAPPDLDDPNLVDLRFKDEDPDGVTWEAYWYLGNRRGYYAAGSSAAPLYVKEAW